MESETCPHCGAGVLPLCAIYDCGTVVKSPQRRSATCHDRELAELRNQLAAVTAERDRLQNYVSEIELDRNRACNELADLQQRIDAAPVARVIFNDRGEIAGIAWGSVTAMAGNSKLKLCRLVRDDQPQQEEPSNG